MSSYNVLVQKVKSPFYFVVCYYPFVTGGSGKRLPCGGLQIRGTTALALVVLESTNIVLDEPSVCNYFKAKYKSNFVSEENIKKITI